MNSNTSVQAHRPVVMGCNGMVASAHPLASIAGLRTLMEGGNAFDATVATAAALNVVEPYMSGMGGVGHLLAYVAAENRTRVLNFSGRAPAAADRLPLYRRKQGTRHPIRSGAGKRGRLAYFARDLWPSGSRAVVQVRHRVRGKRIPPHPFEPSSNL